MITLNVANAVDLMQLVATIKKVFGSGGAAGAVYLPFDVMVPNPVSGLDTVGIVHPVAGPWPAVQFVGGTVVEVLVELQICQNTVLVEAPATFAANCTELFTITVMGEAEGPTTVTPTGVEFPPQLATRMTRSITAPNPNHLICVPPTTSNRFIPAPVPLLIRMSGSLQTAGSPSVPAGRAGPSARTAYLSRTR